MIVPLLLAVVLSIIHYYSYDLVERIEKNYQRLLSFSAGIFITFMILVMLPEITEGVRYIGDFIYIPILLGFVIYHVAEKYFYQHVKTKKALMIDLGGLHLFGFFIDHFLIGFALVLAFNIGNLFGYFIFLPFLLFTFSSSVSLKRIYDRYRTKMTQYILPVSTTLGAITALITSPSKSWYFIIFAFVLGILFYVVVRDLLPQDEKGEPLFFLIGVIISMLLLLLFGFVLLF
jgi:zinc transporter ZupT